MIRRFLFSLFCLACFASLPTTAAGQSGVPVIVAWDPNDDDPDGYVVFIGSEPGVYTETVDVGRSIYYVFSTGVAGQRYYFSVAAYKPRSHLSGMATEVSTVIEARAVAAMEPPEVNGSNVTLRWRAQSASPITDYVLEAGTSSGASDIFRGSVGTTTQISASVGPGTYFVRVIPRTLSHTGHAANEVSFTTAGGECTAPPPAPTGVIGVVHSGTASISWTPAPGATTYGIQAGTGPGLRDIYEGAVGPIPSVSATVGSDFAAYVRVFAANPCGISPASAEIFVK